MRKNRILNFLFILTLVLGLFNVLWLRFEEKPYFNYITVVNYFSVFVILITTILISRFKLRRFPCSSFWPMGFYLLILVIITLYQYWYSENTGGFSRNISLMGYFLLAIALFNQVTYREEELRWSFKIFSCVLFLFLLFQFLFINSPYAYHQINPLEKERFMGITPNPNVLGYISFLTICITFLSNIAERRHLSISAVVIILIASIVMAFAYSKASMIATLLFFIVYYVPIKKIFYLLIIYSPSIFLTVLVLSREGLDTLLEWISAFTTKNPALSEFLRLDMLSIGNRIKAIFIVIFDYLFHDFSSVNLLFGRGLKSWSKSIPIDNLFLFTFYEQGILGLLGLIVIITYPVLAYKKDHSLLNKGMFSLLIAVVFHSNFETTLFAGLTLITLIFLTCYTFISANRNKEAILC